MFSTGFKGFQIFRKKTIARKKFSKIDGYKFTRYMLSVCRRGGFYRIKNLANYYYSCIPLIFINFLDFS